MHWEFRDRRQDPSALQRLLDRCCEISKEHPPPSLHHKLLHARGHETKVTIALGQAWSDWRLSVHHSRVFSVSGLRLIPTLEEIWSS